MIARLNITCQQVHMHAQTLRQSRSYRPGESVSELPGMMASIKSRIKKDMTPTISTQAAGNISRVVGTSESLLWFALVCFSSVVNPVNVVKDWRPAVQPVHALA